MGWAAGPTGQFSPRASEVILNLKSMGWAVGPTDQFSPRASEVVLNLKSMGWAAGPTGGQFSPRVGEVILFLNLKSMGWVAEPGGQFSFRTKHEYWISRGNYVITSHSRSSRAPYRKSGSRKILC